MTAYEQRSYPGAAADTLLNADMASNALTFSVSPGTGAGYPTGGNGPFFIAVDYDTSKAEKIRVTSRINDTFTIAGLGDRGVDGTSAQAHSANAKVRAVWTATDAQEANRAAANTVGKVTTKGDLLAATGANALARVPAGADYTPLVSDASQAAGVGFRTGYVADSHHTTSASVTGLIGGTTPLAAGTQQSYYKQVGDLIFFTWVYQWGGAGQSAMGAQLQLNNVPVANALNRAVGQWSHANGATGVCYLAAGGTTLFLPGTSGQGAGPGEALVASICYLSGTSG